MNHVVLASDQRYIDYLITCLLSLEKTNKNIDITILSNKIENEYKYQIQDIFDLRINFFEISSLLDRKFPLNFFTSNTVFARLWVHEVFNSNDNILYIDADTIVLEDLSELLNLNIDKYPIAACFDGFIDNISHQYGIEYWNDLTNNSESKYFNSGVMIINPKKWSDYNVHKNGIEIIDKYFDKIKFVEQEVLNAIFLGDFLPVSVKWNCQTVFRYNPFKVPINKNIEFDDFIEARKNTKIAHFNSTINHQNNIIKTSSMPSIDKMAYKWMDLHKEAVLRLI